MAFYSFFYLPAQRKSLTALRKNIAPNQIWLKKRTRTKLSEPLEHCVYVVVVTFDFCYLSTWTRFGFSPSPTHTLALTLTCGGSLLIWIAFRGDLSLHIWQMAIATDMSLLVQALRSKCRRFIRPRNIVDSTTTTTRTLTTASRQTTLTISIKFCSGRCWWSTRRERKGCMTLWQGMASKSGREFHRIWVLLEVSK